MPGWDGSQRNHEKFVTKMEQCLICLLCPPNSTIHQHSGSEVALFIPQGGHAVALVEDDHATIESVNPVFEDENLAADLKQALAEVNHARTRNRKVA